MGPGETEEGWQRRLEGNRKVGGGRSSVLGLIRYDKLPRLFVSPRLESFVFIPGAAFFSGFCFWFMEQLRRVSDGN